MSDMDTSYDSDMINALELGLLLWTRMGCADEETQLGSDEQIIIFDMKNYSNYIYNLI
jgi:hypothetical protein